jgi:hypothetical protein
MDLKKGNQDKFCKNKEDLFNTCGSFTAKTAIQNLA